MNTDGEAIIHSFGMASGLYLSACVFVVWFGLSYWLDKNTRKIGSVFIAFSLGFFAFFLTSLLVQWYYDDAVASVWPSWLLEMSKYSVPIGLAVFSLSFVHISVMYSFVSYQLYQENRHLITILLLFDLLIFISISFLNSLESIITISVMNFIPHLILSTWYIYQALKNIVGKILTISFSFSLVVMISVAIIMLTGRIEWFFNDKVLLISLFVFSMVMMVISFTSIRYSYFEAQKYNLIKQMDNKGIVNHILKAIHRNQFYMVYQPQVCPKNRRLTALEALIRWQHPVHGNIPPNEFIPIAEKTGLISKICHWTLVEVLKRQQELMATGQKIPISINFSVLNLNTKTVDFIFEKMKEYGVPEELLSIEITETLFVELNDEVKTSLKRLQKGGIHLSVDDYGTGFSSLHYLKKLSLSELKIDRSFIMDLDKNDENKVIVQSTLDMCRGLGLRVVAEGVENQAVMDKLKKLKCTYVQGYHIAKPMTELELEDWLVSNHYS